MKRLEKNSVQGSTLRTACFPRGSKTPPRTGKSKNSTIKHCFVFFWSRSWKWEEWVFFSVLLRVVPTHGKMAFSHIYEVKRKHSFLLKQWFGWMAWEDMGRPANMNQTVCCEFENKGQSSWKLHQSCSKQYFRNHLSSIFLYNGIWFSPFSCSSWRILRDSLEFLIVSGFPTKRRSSRSPRTPHPISKAESSQLISAAWHSDLLLQVTSQSLWS